MSLRAGEKLDRSRVFVVSLAMLGVACRASAPATVPCTCVAGSASSAAPVAASSVPCATLADRRAAEELYRAATIKFAYATRDGRGCLADLDAADRLDPKHAFARVHLRSDCLMLAGQCAAGRALARSNMLPELDEDEAEASMRQSTALYCHSAQLTAPERLDRASSYVSATRDKNDLDACIAEGLALVPLVAAAPVTTKAERRRRASALAAIDTAAHCALAAHRCDDARKLFTSWGRGHATTPTSDAAVDRRTEFFLQSCKRP